MEHKRERWEIEELVFDKRTLLTLAKIMEKGIFEKIDHVISTGKEANVYRATSKKNYVAVKIYKVETTRFLKKLPYIEGDPRFPKIKKNDWELVKLFASKEFKNLEIATKASVPCPTPYFHYNNVIVMDFLGEGGLPFPKLSEVPYLAKEEDFYDIIENIKKMYKNNLIHADLSAFNILKGDKNYFIDFGQGVIRDHPHAESFLERDIYNILKFFKKHFNIREKLEDVIAYVKDV